MLKWIRWPGLVAFIALSAAVLAFFMLLAAPLVKMGIEKFGTMANGAKVEVADVSLSFSPLGIRLTGLQVADEKQPMQNAFEFDSALAELELAPLFAGRTIIKELSIEGLVFATERTTSGAIEKPQPLEDETVAASTSKLQGMMDNVELPDAKEILAQETLTTETLGLELKHSYEQSKQQLDEHLADIPDEQALAQYETELKALVEGDIKSLDDFRQRKQQLDALQARFKQDQAAIQAARNMIRDSKDTLTAQVNALKAAPAADLAYLSDKYSIDASGASNLTALLFGQEAGEWAAQALYWYEKIRPYLASEGESASVDEQSTQAPRLRDGRVIHFPTSDPWPNFLVRKLQASAQLDWGDLSIQGTDFTHQPKVLGRPALLSVNGANLESIQALNLNFEFAHQRTPSRDTANLNITNWQPDSLKLGLAGLQMQQANTQVQAQAVVTAGELSAEGQALFKQVNFVGQGSNTFEREVVAALASIAQFSIDGQAQGRLTSPSVSLSSDLDKQLSAAFKQRFKQQQAEFEAQLRAQLNAQLNAHLGEHSAVLQELDEAEGGLDAKLAKLQALAQAELEDFEAQQKARAKEKLDAEKDELKNKIRGLF